MRSPEDSSSFCKGIIAAERRYFSKILHTIGQPEGSRNIRISGPNACNNTRR